MANYLFFSSLSPTTSGQSPALRASQRLLVVRKTKKERKEKALAAPTFHFFSIFPQSRT
jgi:hypothetical protein